MHHFTNTPTHSKYELQGTISGLHAIASSGLLLVWAGDRHRYVYLSLVPVFFTDTSSLLHLIYQVPEASWWSWILCIIIATYGIVLDVFALVTVIVIREILKISFDAKKSSRKKDDAAMSLSRKYLN